MAVGSDDVGSTSTFRLQGADLVLEAFADETIAVNLATGRYYSLDLIGAETLELLALRHDVRAVAEHLALRYDTDRSVIEAAVRGLLARRLVDEGLILVASDAEPSGDLPAVARASVPSPLRPCRSTRTWRISSCWIRSTTSTRPVGGVLLDATDPEPGTPASE